MNKKNIVFTEWAYKLGFGEIGMRLPQGKFFIKIITPTNSLTDDEIRTKFQKLSKDIAKGCGLIFELYQRRLSGAIDIEIRSIKDDYDKKRALLIAKREFDYLTQEEIELAIREDQNNGFCQHGIEFDCCPLGCGDL